MSKQMRFHPLFEADVLSAVRWYDARSSEIGTAFLAEVKRAVENVQHDPERRSPVDLGLRYWAVRRFPFVVIYDLHETELLLLGVMHTAQEPKKWLAERR